MRHAVQLYLLLTLLGVIGMVASGCFAFHECVAWFAAQEIVEKSIGKAGGIPVNLHADESLHGAKFVNEVVYTLFFVILTGVGIRGLYRRSGQTQESETDHIPAPPE